MAVALRRVYIERSVFGGRGSRGTSRRSEELVWIDGMASPVAADKEPNGSRRVVAVGVYTRTRTTRAPRLHGRSVGRLRPDVTSQRHFSLSTAAAVRTKRVYVNVEMYNTRS